MYGFFSHKEVCDQVSADLNNKFPDLSKEIDLSRYKIDVNDEDVKLIITPSVRSNSPTTFFIQIYNTGVLRFELDHYPHCCAMFQMNGFSYLGASKKFIGAALDSIFKALQQNYNTGFQRIVLNCVESPRYDEELEYKYNFGDIPPVEETELSRMKYPFIYEWATSKYHQQLLTVNHNTQNIIHFIDCMIGEM